MKPERIRIESLDPKGSLKRSWEADLVSIDETEIVLDGRFDAEVTHPDLGKIRKGTISVEHYWLNRHYNVFRFYEPDGQLKFYYCNANLLPEIANGTLRYIDLELDLIIYPDGTEQLLDESDLVDAQERFSLSDDTIRIAYDAMEAVRVLAHSGGYPFNLRRNYFD